MPHKYSIRVRLTLIFVVAIAALLNAAVSSLEAKGKR